MTAKPPAGAACKAEEKSCAIGLLLAATVLMALLYAMFLLHGTLRQVGAAAPHGQTARGAASARLGPLAVSHNGSGRGGPANV